MIQEIWIRYLYGGIYEFFIKDNENNYHFIVVSRSHGITYLFYGEKYITAKMLIDVGWVKVA